MTHQFPVHVRDHRHYKLYGFVVVRIYEQLSLTGQKRLRGMQRDGLQPHNNLLSLQHEILTAVHLMGRGYDVEMNDLENGSGVDFIASLRGLELEIECKMFTGDIGRQIHRRKALDPAQAPIRNAPARLWDCGKEPPDVVDGSEQRASSAHRILGCSAVVKGALYRCPDGCANAIRLG